MMGADVLFLLQFESLEQDLYDRVAERGDELIRIPEADTHWIRMRGMVMSQLRSKATLDHGDRGYLRISSNTGERLTDAVRRSVRDEFSRATFSQTLVVNANESIKLRRLSDRADPAASTSCEWCEQRQAETTAIMRKLDFR